MKVRRPFARASLCGALFTSMLALAGCPSPDSPVCGEGTEERDGQCVAVVDVMTTCATGTVLNEETNRCEPFIECAPGTELNETTESCEAIAECGPDTRLDLATRTCVPIETCGEGTTLDPATKTCVPDASCGPGTVANPATGLCEPVNPCEEGTMLNPNTGRCESHLGCGTGQVMIDGRCELSNQEIIDRADVLESVPDLNDPALGGTPESIELEPVGEETIFVGNISRPIDFDGDNVEDQDRDFWRFRGTVGQLIDIRVLTAGLPQPAFIVHGPNGYLREGPIGWVAEPQRQIVLPYDGDYEIEIVPAVFVSAGLKLGGTEANYIGIVRVLDMPAPQVLTPGPTGSAPTFSGELVDLTDNLIAVNAPARTPVELSLHNLGPNAEPVLLLFGADGRLISEALLDLAQSTRVNAFLRAENDLLVVVDWVRARGPAVGFAVDLIRVPLLELGTIDGRTTSGTVSVPRETTYAWSFTIPTGVVLDADLLSFLDPDVQIVRPAEDTVRFYDNDTLLFYAGPGEYVLFAYNDTTADRPMASLRLDPIPLIDLGVLDPAGTATATAMGPELGFAFNDEESVWVLARHATGGLLDVQPRHEYGIGDSAIRIFNGAGQRIRQLGRPHLDRHVGVLAEPMEPVLIQVQAAQPAVLDWMITVVAEPPPGTLDLEPNDTFATAVDLGPLPVVTLGRLADLEVDFFTFALPAPLAPGQSVEISFDNLDSTTDSGSVTDAAVVRIFDQNLVPLASIPKNQSDTFFFGVGGPSTVTYVGDFEGTGPFYIEISEAFFGAPSNYALRLRVVDVPMEQEPNDDLPTANVLGELPAVYVGFRATMTVGDTFDVFRLDLADPIPPGRSLTILARNFETNNPFTAQLEDSAGNVLRSQSAVNMVIQEPELAAGTYYIRLGGGSSATRFMYKLIVREGPWTEVEPNDTPAEAIDLGTLGTSSTSIAIEGSVPSGQSDFFTFDLDAPLPAGQGLEVRLWNQSDTSALRIDLHEGPDLTAPLLGFDSNWINWIYTGATGTGPFTIRVQGGSAIEDHYRLRVGFGPPAEHEPNAAQADANVIASLPARIRGTAADDDVDAFVVTLSDPLAANQALRATVANLADSTRMTLAIRDADFTTVLATAAPAAEMVVETARGLPAGTYYVVVGVDNGATNTTDHYELTVEVANAQ